MPPSHTWSLEQFKKRGFFLFSYEWLDGNVIPKKARGWLILNRLPHSLAHTQPSLCLPVSLSVCFGSWCLMAGLLLTLWHLVQTLGPIYGIIKTSKSQRRTILHIWLSAPFSVTPNSPNHAYTVDFLHWCLNGWFMWIGGGATHWFFWNGLAAASCF